MLFEVHDVAGAHCELSVLESGPADGTPMVILHGMRDHAWSMTVLAEQFPEYRVILPHLRGHGDSDKPGVYSLLLFVADLKAMFDHFGLDDAVLIGHSLGGHISGRFTSLYPERVQKLVLLDGMGPPGASEADEDQDEFRTGRWHQAVSDLLMEPLRREMTDESEARDRLSRSNPGLTEAQIALVVDHGLDRSSTGVTWKWDPRVDSIWMTFSHAETEDAYRRVKCPVLMVTGERSLDYWAARRLHLADNSDYYDSEQKRRQALFQQAVWVVIDDAGHMLHYDQPEFTASEIRRFLAGP